MMSKNDERKIIDSLANDKTVEMKSDDLEQMLNIELSKPESEIDGQLVQEILYALEPSEPDQAQMRARWIHVKENLPKRQVRGRWRTGFARMAATVAVISIVLVSTIEDAGAFRWTLIQKILKPVAETFGIIIDDQSDIMTEETETTIYSISDAPSEFVTYATLEEVPRMHGEYIVRPDWLPIGAAFISGSHFSSVDTEVYSLEFAKNEKWINLNVHITILDSAVHSYEFERNLSVPIEVDVGQHRLLLYNNAQESYVSAFWIHENAHYVLSGKLSIEEITQIVASME